MKRRLLEIGLIMMLSACVSQYSSLDFDKQKAAKARVELGLAYLAQHDFALAKVNIDKAMEYAPKYYLPYVALAYFYQQQGNPIVARQYYQQALKLDSTRGYVYNNFGTFLCSQGEFDQAYQQFERALKAKNYYGQTDTYENLVVCANSESNQKQYQRAMQQLQRLDPQRAEKLRNTLSVNHKD